MQELKLLLEERELLGKPFKMYGTIENPLFLAKDVSDWIEHSNLTMMLKGIEEDEQLKIRPKQSLGLLTTNNEYNFLTEDGLNEVLMQSRKPLAKEYKKKIKKILKTVRLKGGYVQENREEEFIDKYFPSFEESTKLAMVHDLKQKNKEFQEEIAQLKPQAEAFKDLMQAEGHLQFLEVCGMVDKGRNSLFQFLRSKKVLTKQGANNVPYGRFRTNHTFKVITTKDEHGHFTAVTMVSPKGLIYIYKLLKKNDMLDEFNSSLLLEMQDMGVSA